MKTKLCELSRDLRGIEMGSDSESQDSDDGKRFKLNPCRKSNSDSNSSDSKARRSRRKDDYVSSRKSRKPGTSRSSRVLGPELPSSFRARRSPEKRKKDEKEDNAFGPVLPPHMLQKKDVQIAKYKEKKEDDDDDDDVIGPLPVDHPVTQSSYSKKKLEERARRLKHDFANKDKLEDKKREEWMMELPPVHSASLGLGPRKFKSRPGPEITDRSSWTDTPTDRERKRRETAENSSRERPRKDRRDDKERHRDEERRHSGSKHKSRRQEKSLLEMHQEKLKQKKKKAEKEAKETGVSTRRPFDRDVDLKTNGLDQAQKKSIFLKSRELDDRFCRGKK